METGSRVLSLIAERLLPSLCTASSQTLPVNAFVLTHIGLAANEAWGPDKRSATSIRRQIDAKIPPPWYKRGLMENAHLTLGRTRKVIPPSWYNRGGGGGGWWTPLSYSFWYVALLRKDYIHWKALTFSTKLGTVYGWPRCWRPVTSPAMVAILDFTMN